MTAIGGADRDVDQFANERIQFTGSPHDLFEHEPCSLQGWRMVGNRLPEIIDVVGFPCQTDIIVNFADESGALFVFN